MFQMSIKLIWSPIFYGFLWIHTSQIQGIPIDNQVTGSDVVCSSDTITVNYETENPFSGRIFVKGNVDDPNCVRNYDTGGGITTSPSITFNLGDCSMQRARMLSPQPGMMQSIVVIISFHRLFITKVDKAYKVQCFYMEAEKTVTHSLEVSMLTTEDLRDTGRMPICTYSVKSGARDGPPARFAQIGDPIYHEWECDSDNHKMLIKDCYVNDGQDNKYQIIDERGCALDKFIMPDILYDPEGLPKASVEAHVFKFADRTSVFFQCTIQLCSVSDEECSDITPPVCQQQPPEDIPLDELPPSVRRSRVRSRTRTRSRGRTGTRTKRGAQILSNRGPAQESLRIFSLNEMDLLTDPISVIDIPESVTTSEDESQTAFNGISIDSDQPKFENDDMCFSTTGVGVMVAFVAGVLLMSIVVIAMLFLGRFRQGTIMDLKL